MALRVNPDFVPLPNMVGALSEWFQPMVFTLVSKAVKNFDVVETPTTFNFLGVMQPFTAEQLQLKPEGQRSWVWNMLHADPSLILKPDEVVNYLGVQYRVMRKSDYSKYGYVQYDLIEDFTGSGP